MGDSSTKTSFWQKFQLPIKITSGVVIAGLFAGSMVYAVYCGGELTESSETETSIKGILSLNSANYATSYFEGDTFSFDKDENTVSLVAKDPLLENVVQINNLPGPEYGFIVTKTVDENGNIVTEDTTTTEETTTSSSTETSSDVTSSTSSDTTTSSTTETNYTVIESEIYTDASSIVMSKDMGEIQLVSIRYPSLRYSLTTEVYGSLDESKLGTTFTLEAEDADLYKDGTLLSDEQKETLPDTDKPFRSDKGTTIAGESCSGGACLRNFQSQNMMVDFQIVSSTAGEVSLDIMICLRKDSKTFGEYFVVEVNGNSYDSIDDQVIPQGSDYFTPYSLETVTVSLNRGLNHITFSSGSNAGTSNPVNLDAIKLTSTSSTLGLTDAIVS